MVFLTKLKPEPMGAHSLSAAYGVNSLVMSEDGAAAYISVKDVPAGTPLTDTDYWQPHTDLSAVVQKASAARDEMLEIARNLTDAVEKSGNPVQAELVGGLPFDRVATALEPIQAGSGDPSPTNIRPISGRTGAKLTRCGNNIAKSIISTGNTSIWGVSLFIDADLEPSTTYTISFVGTAGNSVLLNGEITDDSYWIGIKGEYESFTFTTKSAISADDYRQYTSGKGWIIFKNTRELSTPTIYTDVQIELGSTATTYEPYHGDTYAAEFGQTVYGGTLDWQTGVLTVDTGYKAFDGTEGVIENDKYYLMYPDNAHDDGNQPVVSSHFKKLESLAEGEFDGVQGISLSWGLRFYLRATYSTLDEFKAYLAAQYSAGTPVQVAYKLATPTTIQLTPREISQLHCVNTLCGDGSISIVGRANPAIALDARIAALEAAAHTE